MAAELPTLPTLESLTDQLSACIKCAACMPVCPTYRPARRESMGPRGRLALAVGLLSGEVSGAQINQSISSCIDCRACVPACPRHLPLEHIFYAAKAALASRSAGGWTVVALRKIARYLLVGRHFKWVLRLGSLATRFYTGIDHQSPVAQLFPFFRNGRKRQLPQVISRPFTHHYPEVSSPPSDRDRPARVVFFPGCVINFTSTDIGHATMATLDKLGVEVILPQDAPCCGIPLLSLGDQDAAREVARDVVQRYGSIPADAIVTACASCGTTLRDTYPTLLKDDPLDVDGFANSVMDITEYIARHTDYAERAQPLPHSVTYHDPCHLVRGMGVTQPPRELLQIATGDGLTEMADAATCCGFGGLFSALHYDLSLEVGAHKAQRVKEANVSYVATGCPGCQMHMNDTLSRNQVPTQVVHTVELLNMSLPERTPAPTSPPPT